MNGIEKDPVAKTIESVDSETCPDRIGSTEARSDSWRRVIDCVKIGSFDELGFGDGVVGVASIRIRLERSGDGRRRRG